MDWPESTQPVMTLMPRGLERDGGMLGPQRVDANPARWRSQYASLITSIYGIGTADGLNEHGLAGHLLYLEASDFGPRDPSRPGLHAGLWVQYLLDGAATVSEALMLLDDVQLLMVSAHGRQASVHIALEDASGDSAIVEHIDGAAVIHHGREFTVMTNDPTYDEQLALLAALDLSHPSRDMPLPGNVNARDRFQRASYYAALMPSPSDEREAVAGVLAVARNVSVPFGAPYGEFGIYDTEYRTVCDLVRRRYLFELTTSPSVIWASFDAFELTAGSPVLGFDPRADFMRSGDVSDAFQAIAAPF
jgi:choloylglycine hydrolase